MSKFKLRDGTKIWYKIKGNGPLLVLNHGYTSSHASFEYLISYLKNDFTCLSWDNRGHGRSDKPIKETYEETAKIYSLPQFVEDCHQLLLGLNIVNSPKSEKIFMYGVSMGGLIAQMYAIKYGQTLKAIGLGATTSSFNLPKSKNQMTGKIPLSKKGSQMKVSLTLTKKMLEKHPEVFKKKIKKNFLILDDTLLVLPENVFSSFNLEKYLQKLTIPVIILYGEKDELMKVDNGKRLSQLIPNNEFYSFPGVHHNINQEIPQVIARHLKNFFLKRI
jgi:pimeloyl-ACP methyl ester carboxylesterase